MACKEKIFTVTSPVPAKAEIKRKVFYFES